MLGLSGSSFKAQVTSALKAYRPLKNPLRRRVIDYLVDGEDATCLLEIPEAIKQGEAFFKVKHNHPDPANPGDATKLLKCFELADAPAGYYQRLGEMCGQIPEISKAMLDPDDRLPKWFFDLFRLRRLLTGGSNVYFMGVASFDSEFHLGPIIGDLKADIEIGQLFLSVVDLDLAPYAHIARVLRTACDWKAICEQHPDELSDALRSVGARSREETLTWLGALQSDTTPLVPVMCELAVSSSKMVRPAALGFLLPHREAATSGLVHWLENGNTGARCFAVEALIGIEAEDLEGILTSALKTEKGKRVRQTLENALSTLASGDKDSAGETDEDDFQLEPVNIAEGIVPLPDAFVEALWAQFESGYQKQLQQYEKQLEAYKNPDRPRWMQKPTRPVLLSKKEFKAITDYVEGNTTEPPKKFADETRQLVHQLKPWPQWTDATAIELIHVVRMLDCFGLFHHYGSDGFWLQREDLLESHHDAQATAYGLREVDRAFASLSTPRPGDIATAYLSNNTSWDTFLDWPPEQVWPIYIEYPEVFRKALTGQYTDRKRTAFRVAAMMPRLSSGIETMIWGVALGEAKSDRHLARAALHAATGHLQRTLVAIADGKQAVRIAGAEMLVELRDPEAVEPLKKALRKEKQEFVKGVFLQAIEAAGGDVDEFLGQRKQLIDAKKGLEKRRPKGMEWFPIDSLPTVRWTDSDKPVPSEIVQWWVVQSIQFKQPTCGALLRRALEMCRSDDTSALARHLLSTWIAYDSKTLSRDEVIDQAKIDAAAHWNGGTKWMREYYGSEEKLVESLVAQRTSEFQNSGIGQKGILAIVAGAGGRECVKMIERYIRKFHGHRLAQSKALVEVLAWIDDRSAISVLLSLSNRFRTKAIRKRAEELVNEIADRQGWTMDQLADRTIPDAGFTREEDEDGNPIGDRDELVLDYGSRSFSVILGDKLEAVITRDDGKQVKSLPAAGKNDDPDLVKVAKKEFSAAKKTVKEVVKNLAERFYEAACVQRSWPVEDWERFLAAHPIAGALCRRVVWAASPEETGADPQLFRPLEDGSLTDVNDDEFTLDRSHFIFIAHSSLLDEEAEAAWRQHLEDYEVPNLFQQFGRDTYRLPEKLRSETELSDFQGHMLTTFRLRSKATKLGWMRGEAEDGGCFSVYHKPFRSQGVEAIMEFSGSYVPEEDIPAALRTLYFTPISKKSEYVSSWNIKKTKLEKVPPVLLSECYNDMRDVAAEGTGFDADWEKKGLW